MRVSCSFARPLAEGNLGPAAVLSDPCVNKPQTLEATRSFKCSMRVGCAAGDGRRGWLLLRASLHDPLLVLNVESDVPGGAAKMASQVPVLARVPRQGSMLGTNAVMTPERPPLCLLQVLTFFRSDPEDGIDIEVAELAADCQGQ